MSKSIKGFLNQTFVVATAVGASVVASSHINEHTHTDLRPAEASAKIDEAKIWTVGDEALRLFGDHEWTFEEELEYLLENQPEAIEYLVKYDPRVEVYLGTRGTEKVWTVGDEAKRLFGDKKWSFEEEVEYLREYQPEALEYLRKHDPRIQQYLETRTDRFYEKTSSQIQEAATAQRTESLTQPQKLSAIRQIQEVFKDEPLIREELLNTLNKMETLPWDLVEDYTPGEMISFENRNVMFL